MLQGNSAYLKTTHSPEQREQFIYRLAMLYLLLLFRQNINKYEYLEKLTTF